METSRNRVDETVRKMKRKADVVDLDLPFRRLLDAMIDIVGSEIAEIKDSIIVLEGKVDRHIATLRSDVSHVRQAVRSDDK